MKTALKRLAIVNAVALPLTILVGPLLVPIPPLKGTHPPRSLADPDSQFIEIAGLEIHVKTNGQGQPTFVLLHGFGASLYSWQAVMEPLGRMGRVIAYDRPAFGLTQRPLQWNGQNPYSPESQVEIALGLLDHFGAQRAILVGNSLGGAVAIQMALAHPERVAGLILVDAAVKNHGGVPGWLRPLLTTPQMRRLGPLLVRQIQRRGMDLLNLAWHDPSQLSPETIAQYRKPLQVEHWDRALWEFTLASHPLDLERHLAQLHLPALVVTGDDDRIIPTADSIRLSRELPDARLTVISQAGHVPHEERPAAFIQAVQDFLTSQEGSDPHG